MRRVGGVFAFGTYQNPAEFRKFVENDIARWTQFVEAVGVEKLKGDVPAQ